MFTPIAVYAKPKAAAPGVPWTPADNANTFVWYDAADVSTITTVSGDVSQWDDKSGNGYNATQTTAANRPAYGATQINSIDVITFGGTGTVALNTPITPYSSRDLSMYILFKHNLKSSWQVLAIFAQGGGSNVVNLLAEGGTSTEWATYLNSPYYASTTLTPGNNVLLSMVGDNATTNADFWLNGNSDGSTGAGNFGTTSVFSGGQGYIGTDNYGSYAIADIAEIVLVDAQDSTADRQKMEGYLAWKWGTQGSLPLGHPYKNAAPTV